MFFAQEVDKPSLKYAISPILAVIAIHHLELLKYEAKNRQKLLVKY